MLDSTGVDGVTGAELGTIGLLDENGTAELESRGLEEAAALVAGLDGVGVGVDDGFTGEELGVMR